MKGGRPTLSPPLSPRLFDRHLVRVRRDRAACVWGAHDFLLRRVMQEIMVRLGGVGGSFERVLDMGSGGLLGGVSGRIPGVDLGVVVRTDLSFGLLRSSLRSGGVFGVVADEEALPFAAGSFGLVMSALCLHRVNDVAGVLRRVRELLRPGGVFLGAAFGAGTLGELRQVLVRTEMELHGGASPRVSPFGDVRDFGNLLQRVGFEAPVVDRQRLTVHYPTLTALVSDLRGMGDTNALLERRRAFVGQAFFPRAEALYRELFSYGGQLEATFDIVYLIGWREP